MNEGKIDLLLLPQSENYCHHYYYYRLLTIIIIIISECNRDAQKIQEQAWVGGEGDVLRTVQENGILSHLVMVYTQIRGFTWK